MAKQLAASPPAAVGAKKRKKLSTSLWVDAEAPPLPPVLSPGDFLSYTATQRQDFFHRLVPSVLHRMTEQLAKPRGSGGIDLKVPLHEVPPPRVEDNKAGNSVTTFREPWNAANAEFSVATTQWYEAAGLVYWFDAMNRSWEGQDVCWEVSMSQYQAALGAWTKEVFTSSNKDPSLRRYIFEGTFPTAVSTLAELQQAKAGENKDVSFKDLPLLAGHGLILGFYGACDEALRENDGARLLKLHEAGNSVLIRVRLGPDVGDVVKDSLRWSEQVRAMAAAGADSFLQFVSKVVCIPSIKAATCKIQSLLHALKTEGIHYACKPASRATAVAIAAVMPFAAVGAVRNAVQALDALMYESGCSVNEMTKLQRMCQLADKLAGQQSKEFLVFLIEALHVGLEFNDLKASELKVEFLTSQAASKQAAFVHYQAKKFLYDVWLREAIGSLAASAGRESIREGLEKVLDSMPRSPTAFARRFASGQPETASVIGDESGGATRPCLGIRSATETVYKTFRDTLQETPQLVADLFYLTATGQCDEEFMALAMSELQDRSVSFSDYFKRAVDGGETGPLQDAYVAYAQSLAAKPTSAKVMEKT